MLKIKKKSQYENQTQEQKVDAMTHKATDLLKVYGKQMIIGASLLAAVLVIGGAYMIKKSVDERKSGPLLAAAEEVYNVPGASKADLEKALELFRGVRNEYSGTMNAYIAHYYIGNCLADLGQTDEALKEYQSLVDSYSGDKFLLVLVYQRMGYLSSALGKQADAVKAFEQAEMLGGPGVATVELAKQYNAAGDSIKAQEKYKVVQDKLGGTSWAGEAMGKVQAIKPAPQPASGNEEK